MAGMTERTAQRPGTKQFRFALIGFPASLVFLVVLLGFDAVEDSDAGYWVIQLLALVGVALLFASLVAVLVGLWKRLA